MTTYARCVAFVGRSDNLTIGACTLGKEYPLFEPPLDGCDFTIIGAYTLGKEYPLFEPPLDGCDFTIIDDSGWVMPCWWNTDPDCIWERIER